MPHSRCLFVIEDVFEIKGRGIILVPGIKPIDDELFRAGNYLLLKRPNGTTLRTQIASLELFTPNPRHEVTVLLRGLTRQDLPIGTEVWSTVTP